MFRQKRLKMYLLFFISIWLSACVGSPVASYKTDVQKFNWGTAYVWMSRVPGSRHDDTEGSGYLQINFTFKKRVMKKNCAITVKNTYLEDPNTGVILINAVPTYSDSSPMTREIGKYNIGNLTLYNFPFEYNQSSFPYHVKLDLAFNCEGKQTLHTFDKEIKYRMVQPVIWEQ